MKKVVSLLLLTVFLISIVPFSFADDFNVSHTIIESNDDIKMINVILPIFEGFKGADEVNRRTLNIALDAIGESNATAKDMLTYRNELIQKGAPVASMLVSLDMTYDYVKLGNILSVQLNIYSYSGGAHGSSQVLSITSNTSTGEIYEFKDLFKKDADYNKTITDLILREIEKDPDKYFLEYKETILRKKGDYDFYIDGDKLVVYFGLYDIAPYAAGIRHFVIDSKDIKDILKVNLYKSMKDGRQRGIINFNGEDLRSKKGLVNIDNTLLLPLRIIAEALDYDVDWNKKNGALVGGQPVTIKPRIVKNGTSYVPLKYFKDVLGENVSLGVTNDDKIIVRIFNKADKENSNYNLAAEYLSPYTAEDAINIYAEAVKMRNGLVQYALFDDKLRAEKYGEFKDLGFVTGTSSPWIESYEINKIDDFLYRIIFKNRSSVASDRFTHYTNIKLIEDGQYIRIRSIDWNSW